MVNFQTLDEYKSSLNEASAPIDVTKMDAKISKRKMELNIHGYKFLLNKEMVLLLQKEIEKYTSTF